MFEATELRLILDALEGKEVTIGTDEETGKPIKVTANRNPALRAMVLLAANCAFGQSDLSNLPRKAVDLDSAMVDFARVKNAIRRRIPLWPETVAAIHEWLPQRPKAKAPADVDLLFLTCRGARWVRISETGSPCDALGREFDKVLRRLKLKRSRVSLYALRHGFETIAGETTDQVAVDAVMGHSPKGMAGVYRERIGDDRLRRVVDHVRAWLFGSTSVDPSPKTNPENSDPCDPSDPPPVFPEENRGKAGSQNSEGPIRLATPTQTGSQDSEGPGTFAPPTIAENSAKTGLGSHGLQGSQIRQPEAPPALRLFIG
jgi:hypothetical protein